MANAHKNCDDAHQTAELKARAARYAALRISRDAQARKVISYNHWKDAEEKARELRKKRNKQATLLKKTTVTAAVAMVHKLYGKPGVCVPSRSAGLGPKGKGASTSAPCPEADDVPPYVATPGKIPKQRALDKSSKGFAQAFIPVDLEETKVN